MDKKTCELPKSKFKTVSGKEYTVDMLSRDTVLKDLQFVQVEDNK